MLTLAELRAEIRRLGALSRSDLAAELGRMDRLRVVSLAKAAGLTVRYSDEDPKRMHVLVARCVSTFRRHYENTALHLGAGGFFYAT